MLASNFSSRLRWQANSLVANRQVRARIGKTSADRIRFCLGPRRSRGNTELYRQLAKQGKLIGTNDLWIAATALAHGHGIVTNNRDEFSRVPGLVVETF
jgi:predicted nucleic acid-binding protein